MTKKSRIFDMAAIGLCSLISLSVVTNIKQKNLEKRIEERAIIPSSSYLEQEDEDMPYANNLNRNDKYKEFNYKDEIPQIFKHAKRIGIEPELLMAIRSGENGRDSLAYGILPQGSARDKYERDEGYNFNNRFYTYENEKEKQLCWASWTIKRNYERFQKNKEGHEDFISYLASKYAPKNADNDPSELNKNWERNVRFFYVKALDKNLAF